MLVEGGLGVGGVARRDWASGVDGSGGDGHHENPIVCRRTKQVDATFPADLIGSHDNCRVKGALDDFLDVLFEEHTFRVVGADRKDVSAIRRIPENVADPEPRSHSDHVCTTVEPRSRWATTGLEEEQGWRVGELRCH